ncbi:unnamed protein product [Adineta ricciae]|uniref:Condensation domain-containing protein n=1 Tax=Adineta ricciae TaxID=249248 RepID=A0A815NXX2_ADIRI|nr:unnamed protein product [Adineta ricciae]
MESYIANSPASFAQERIFLDEQVRFSDEVAIYNELLVLRVVEGSVSIARLLKTLQHILSKHTILRTSIIFDNEDSTLKQYITDSNLLFSLFNEKTFENESELFDIIYKLTINPTLFNLSEGRVFHCEILRQQNSCTDSNGNEWIKKCDILIMAFHHAVFDGSTVPIFLENLTLTYNNNYKITCFEDDHSMQYIDYSVHERLMDMTLSREFWHSELEGYDSEHASALPVDRYYSTAHQRSGLSSTAFITFSEETSKSFLDYASSHQVTPFQLGLAIFYTFLFKLTHGQTDQCISCVNANRYRTELQDLIGMFVSTLPYRVQIDPYWSFVEVVRHVREKCLSILEHSHYPLQHILADFHFNPLSIPFLQSTFDIITVTTETNYVSLKGASLEYVPMELSFEAAKIDFLVRFVYNPVSNENQLSCSFIGSRDLFDQPTIPIIGMIPFISLSLSSI